LGKSVDYGAESHTVTLVGIPASVALVQQTLRWPARACFFLHQPRQPLDGTANQIGFLLDRLHVHYEAADTPYGNDEQGF
jgi:hypothetical protein